MIRVLTFVLLAGVLIIGGFAILNKQDQSDSNIKIGVIMPLSGDNDVFRSQKNALELAVSEINTDPIFNRKIELFFEDGKCDSKFGGIAAKKLVEVHGVKIIIGGSCSEETLSAAKVTDSEGVVLISPSASDYKLSEAGDFVFRIYPSEASSGLLSAAYATSDMKLKKAAIISDDLPDSQSIRDSYKKYLSDFGSQILLDETYNQEGDFMDKISKIKSLKPDIVYVISKSDASSSDIVNKIKNTGLNAYFSGPTLKAPKTIAKNSGSVFDGIIADQVIPDWNTNVKAKKFLEAYKVKFPSESAPDVFALSSYDTLFIVRDAILANSQSGEIDTLKIRDWLYSLKNWPGGLGLISININGDAVFPHIIRKVVKSQIIDSAAYLINDAN